MEVMEPAAIILALVPSSTSIIILFSYLAYLAISGSVLPGKIVPGAVLSDGSRLHYRCNGLISLLLLTALLGTGVYMNLLSPTVIADRGVELLSTTFIFSLVVTDILFAVDCKSRDQSSSLKAHATGNFIHDWWFGVQLNPQIMGLDLKKKYARWQCKPLSYPLPCFLCALHYRLLLLRGVDDFHGWWLLRNKVELTKAAAIVNCLVFLVGYHIFRGTNKQKHEFKKNPKALIWGKPPKVIGGKLLVSGYWGVSRHCNYLGDLLLALSFSLPCGISSVIPYFYPIYLLILLVWRERRDEARCSQKYKEIWDDYCKAVPWRIVPYLY